MIMKQIEVVAAIICKDDKIFATQRGYGEWKDWWVYGDRPRDTDGHLLAGDEQRAAGEPIDHERMRAGRRQDQDG